MSREKNKEAKSASDEISGPWSSIDGPPVFFVKETLKIEFGLPKNPFCEECGDPIDIIEYMARKIHVQNGLCFSCLKKLIKGE